MENFLDLFAGQVRRFPHATAASDGHACLSYRELDEISDSFARQLNAASVGRGDIVGIGLERGLGFLVSMIGLFKVGAAYLPLDRTLPRDRRAYMLEQCSCKWLITDDDIQGLFDGIGLLMMPERFEGMTGGTPFERSVLTDDSLAYVIFTSGSTGMPKGAMVHHGGMVNHLLAKVDDLGMHIAPNVAQTAPQSFDISVWQFLAPLICAGRTAILTRSEFLDLDRLGARIVQDEIDILQVVPSHLLAILDAIIVDADNARFDRLTCLVATGEVLPVSLARRWLATKPHIPLINAYGPTECSDDVTHQVISEMPSVDQAIPIGRAVRGVHLTVRDTDGGELSVGEVGELYVEGIAVGLGYIARPDLTLKAFVTVDGQRAYKTGDLVSCDSEGVYHYHGRTDDQVKVRGHRIELSEVEFGILRLAQIKQAAVVLNTSNTRAFLTAFIVEHEDAATDPESLRLQLRDHLPEHMIPSEFRLQSSLPETPNGKIDKKKLTAIANDTPLSAGTPGTGAETVKGGQDFLEIWRDLLRNPSLQPTDDFFRQGADSILALQFIARAKALGHAFTLGDVFRNPTILGLLKVVRTKMAVADAPRITGAKGQSLPRCEPPAGDSLSFLPMSPAQRGIFVQSLRSRHSNTYILQYSFRIAIPDGGVALQAGWRKAHERHELLRSAFILDPSSHPVRVVADDAPLRWTTTDLSHLDEGQQRIFLETFLREDKQAGFALDQPALYRLHLFHLGGADYQFILSAHHLIVDGASIFPLMTEVLGGRPAPSDVYSTYIAGQEKFRLETPDQLLWAELLEPFEVPVCISDHLGEPTLSSVQHARLRKRLDADLGKAIGDICVRAGITISAVAATAWAMALNSVCGGQHQLFGMIVSGRAETGVGLDDVGMYANTLPIPVALYPSDRLDVSLQEVSRRIAELLRFESVSMNEVLVSTRSRFANVVFDTVLNVETLANWAALESAGNSVELTHVTDLTEFPFAVEVLSSGDAITVDFNWDPERVSKERAAGLSEQFLSALAYICDHDSPMQEWQGWQGVPASVSAIGITKSTPVSPSVLSSFDAVVLAAAREIIGDDTLALHHNFFSSGGDSISALQLIARLRRDAMAIDLDRIFASRSLTDIALGVRYLDSTVGVKSYPPIGPTSLVPVQRWFAEQSLANADHWCLGTAIEIRRSIHADALTLATRQMLEHYPVLSAQFKVSAEGYSQTIPARPFDAQMSSRIVQLSGPIDQSLNDIRDTLSGFQESLDLVTGDLFRVVLFRTPDTDADLLVLLAHHLVVDAVSLRILVEDFLHLCAGVTLPAEVTPFRSWAQQLVSDDQSFKSDVLSQTAYWSEVVDRIPASVPFDPDRPPSRRAGIISSGLSFARTTALVRDVPAAYNTRINDILISALVRALSGWRGKNEIAINLEGHGRESVLDGVDISRTVGWFTSVFPVCLEDPQGGLADLIQQTKRTLAEIPQRGIGYGLLRYLFNEPAVVPQAEPMVQFNYLGQWDNVSFDDADVSMPSARVLSLVDQVSVDPRNGRQHALEIEARITQGRFEIDWYFDDTILSSQEAQDIATRYSTTLDEIITHCSRATLVRVPSDYPDANLIDDELQDLINKAGAVPADIYPLSPTQKGILFQHLMSNDDTYILQYVLDIDGEIDISALQDAWRLMAERHPILRSGFYWDAVAGPLQYVSQEERSTWSVIAGGDDPMLFKRVMENDRSRGFDLETPALTRFTLLSHGAHAHKLIWTYHHILLDGWCVARVIKELFDLYDHLIRGDQPAPAFGGVYRDYIEWLADQGARENRPFWRNYLSGISPCVFTSTVAYQPATPADHAAYRFMLGHEQSRAIERFCVDHGVTVAVVFQRVWAQILAQNTGNHSPVFGWAISGRPADLDGAEDIIGLMTSIVPCTVDVAGASTVSGVRELQRRNAALQDEGHVSMSHFKSASGLSQEEELFNTVLVIENFELQDNLPAGDRYRLSNLQWVERSEFPLVLGLVPAEDFLIELNFNHEKFCVAQMADLQERIVLELARLSSLGNGNLEHDASLQCETIS
ncbi:non-ribosomal peptide synthetase [Pseudomonas sp. 10S4]|uniref:non-ribosomal peptide synthetase n=1 Tax=Pseudomonas sp. 10S4 TaxID=3048583 RepID=UPI002B2340B7|nr:MULTISPECIES: non-ribosomal peptide synthetase [unclassified Pseudomonas]MEB0223153.1 amino acid adenylation domain-containing protein [Pseudomonas sp. 5S1]MEB0296035.1 amino acid adenylation domain-containing protein [Pseudomonas sp. 10S4]